MPLGVERLERARGVVSGLWEKIIKGLGNWCMVSSLLLFLIFADSILRRVVLLGLFDGYQPSFFLIFVRYVSRVNASKQRTFFPDIPVRDTTVENSLDLMFFTCH